MIRTYTVDELEKMSGVTRRTIGDYVAKGILAGPSHRGRGARYPQTDVDLLQLVPRVRTLMKKEFPNLKALSGFLRRLSGRDVNQLARISSEKTLVREVRRLRVRSQLETLFPTLPPERIDEALEGLTPAQISGIDAGRYPIGAVLDLSDLIGVSQPAAETAAHDSSNGNGHISAPTWSVSWLSGGASDVSAGSAPQPDDVRALEASLRNLERSFADDDDDYEEPLNRSVDQRLADISERVERLERLLET